MKDRLFDQPSALGSRLKLVRNQLGKTQTEMAEKLGISLSHYSKLEVGIGSMGRALAYNFCRMFKVNEAWLVFGEGEPPEMLAIDTSSIWEPLRETFRRLQHPHTDHELISKIINLSNEPALNQLADNIAKTLEIPLNRAMAMIICEKLRAEKIDKDKK